MKMTAAMKMAATTTATGQGFAGRSGHRCRGQASARATAIFRRGSCKERGRADGGLAEGVRVGVALAGNPAFAEQGETTVR